MAAHLDCCFTGAASRSCLRDMYSLPLLVHCYADKNAGQLIYGIVDVKCALEQKDFLPLEI